MRLFQPDHKIPATRVLFDTRAMAARVQSWFGTRELGLSISGIRYKPNTSCLVSYQTETELGRSCCHVKAFQKTDWENRKRKLVETPQFDLQNRNVLIDDELAFCLFRFPGDSELAGIEKFTADPQAFLSRVLLQNHCDEKCTGFETLAYKPNRRFAAKLNFESGNRFVLKIHDASKFERALNSASALKHSSAIDLPYRVGRSNRHRALAYQWIEGSKFDFATIESGECKPMMASIFEFLDRMHSQFDVAKSSLPVQIPEHGLCAIAGYVANIFPPVGAVARRIQEEILANLPVNHPLTLIHGDFHEQQLVVTDDGVKACDFDNCCLGDPTADLANFVANVQYRASLNELSMDVVAQVNHLSTKHLVDTGDRNELGRFLWNQMAGMFRLATHPFRSGAENWVEQTERFLSHIAEQIQFVNHTLNATVNKSLHRKTSRTHALPSASSSAASSSVNSLPDSQQAKLSADAIVEDPRFEFLSNAFDKVAARLAIGSLDPPLDEFYGPFEIVDIHLRRHKPGRRCLIEYELKTASGHRSILGKASAKRLDRSSYQTQAELYRRHGFGQNSDDGISVPRPLGGFEPWKMWFQEKVDSIPGAWFLENDKLDQVTERIASTLAKLHTCDLTPKRKHTVSDEMTILVERLNQVIVVRPSESHRIERVLKNCASIAEAIDDGKSTSIHRDFYHDQIMFSDQRSYVVDLDLVSSGHPALDVGNLLAHLTEHAIRRFDDRQYWFEEENEIANHYMARMWNVTSWEIAAFKAISFARHIFISESIEDRRKATSQIIDVADELTSDAIHRLKIKA